MSSSKTALNDFLYFVSFVVRITTLAPSVDPIQHHPSPIIAHLPLQVANMLHIMDPLSSLIPNTYTTCFLALFTAVVFFLSMESGKEKGRHDISSARTHPPPKTMQEYLETLLSSKLTKKKLLKYDFFCMIYKVTMENGEPITVKKVKPYNRVLSLIVAFAQHVFWRFIKRNTRKPQVASSIEAASSSQAYLSVCKHRTRCIGLHVLVSKALQNYDSGAELASKPRERLERILKFCRAVGYFHAKSIPMLDLDWDDKQFVENLIELGSVLPPQDYAITIIIRSEGSPLINLDIKGPLKSVPEKAKRHIDEARVKAKRHIDEARVKAKRHIDEARVKAMRRLKEAKDQLSDRLKNLVEDDLDFEIDGTVSPAQSESRPGTPTEERDENQAELDSLIEYRTQAIEQAIEQAIKMANKLSDMLQKQSPLDVQLALRNPTVTLASAFYKRVDGREMKDAYENLVKQVVAARNGIPADIFDVNPGLQSFLQKNHLHRYLLVYRHSLRMDRETQECSIMCQGDYRSWRDIQRIIKTLPNSDVIKGQYSRHGLINQGFYDWHRLEPFYISESTWGQRHLLEVCSWVIDEPRMGGDHTWIRLKTPRGECYSVGQYRPQKMGFHEQFVFPMKIKPSKFMSPDVSEFWRGPYTVCAFEITEQEFRKMKKQIEHDQRNREYTYQLFHGNCTRYAKSIAEIAQIDLPASIPLIKLFVRNERVHEITRRFLNAHYTPKWVRPCLIRLWAVCFNSFGLLWGSGIVDKEVKEDPIYRNVQPYIKDIYDLTDPEKVITHHPFIIGHFVRKEIESWRADQIEPLRVQRGRLADRLREIQKILGEKQAKGTVDLENERVEVVAKMEEIEKQMDNLKYTCPPNFLKRPGMNDLKENPWVGKTRVTDDVLLEDDEQDVTSTTTETDASSTGTFDFPPFGTKSVAPPRRKSVVPADVMIMQEEDGYVHYVEIQPSSVVATPTASAISSPVMSVDSLPSTPTIEDKFELPPAAIGKVKGVFVGDSVEDDKIVLGKGLEIVREGGVM